MLGLSNHFPKNMCESMNLVHQKGDPYRTKGRELTYCQIAVFQAFGGAKKQPSFRPNLAVAKALAQQCANDVAPPCKSLKSVD
jgi:hypothetical protein